MSSGIYNKHTGYHNRRSIRLQGYDYSQPGYYFVTVCIHDRKQMLFGDVVEKRMILNEYGKCVEHCWNEIPVHFPHAKIDECVIMPNHVHGIIQLHMSDIENVAGDQNPGADQNPVGVQNFEPLRDFDPIRQCNVPQQNIFQHIIPRSIGSIIRGFKIGVPNYFAHKNPVLLFDNAIITNTLSVMKHPCILSVNIFVKTRYVGMMILKIILTKNFLTLI